MYNFVTRVKPFYNNVAIVKFNVLSISKIIINVEKLFFSHIKTILYLIKILLSELSCNT